MKCPACGNELSNIEVKGIQLDICKGGCGGIWFDTYEFKKFDEPHEYAGDELLDIEKAADVKVDDSEKRNCPRCDNIPMMQHFYSVKKTVKIDECAGCAGVWLDADELSNIRSLFGSEEEKLAATSSVFDDLFGAQLEIFLKESQTNKDNARRIANLFKYISPSYYIPGKQDWGAF